MTVFDADGFPQWESGAMTIELAPRNRWNFGGPEILSPKGVNLHRVDGTLGGGYRAFNDPTRFATAWQWTVGLDGHLYVHLPWFVRGIHSNGGNVWGPAVECEGYWHTPITDAQVQTLQRLLRDFGETVGFEINRANGALKEHREWAQTTCPGDSYAPLYAALAEEDEMTEEEIREIVRDELDKRGYELNVVQYLNLRTELAESAWDKDVDAEHLKAAIRAARGV